MDRENKFFQAGAGFSRKVELFLRCMYFDHRVPLDFHNFAFLYVSYTCKALNIRLNYVVLNEICLSYKCMYSPFLLLICVGF